MELREATTAPYFFLPWKINITRRLPSIFQNRALPTLTDVEGVLHEQSNCITFARVIERRGGVVES